MKKTILLTLVAAGMTLSAAAAPKRLASVLEVEHGMDLSDPRLGGNVYHLLPL